jgi:hypothetical protein
MRNSTGQAQIKNVLSLRDTVFYFNVQKTKRIAGWAISVQQGGWVHYFLGLFRVNCFYFVIIGPQGSLHSLAPKAMLRLIET